MCAAQVVGVKNDIVTKGPDCTIEILGDQNHAIRFWENKITQSQYLGTKIAQLKPGEQVHIIVIPEKPKVYLSKI